MIFIYYFNDVTKSYAADLKLYTSLISTDDRHNIEQYNVQSARVVWLAVKSQCE